MTTLIGKHTLVHAWNLGKKDGKI